MIRFLQAISIASLLLTFLLWPAAQARAAEENILSVGQGSYTNVPPPGEKQPPEKIWRSANLKGPMPTTNWWASLAWVPYSHNQFPHPLAVCAKERGLQVSYPGANIHAVAKHAFGSMTNDLTVGHSAAEKFPSAVVDGYSDWFVTALFADGPSEMRVTYGHGSPFVYATFKGGAAKINFSGKPEIWSGEDSSAALGITIHGRHYGLFGSANSVWRSFADDQKSLFNAPPPNTPNSYCTIAILPDNQPATLARFQECAHRHVTNTQVEWAYNPETSTVTTTHHYTTTAMEGPAGGTLFALYPHQWQNTDAQLLPHEYGSIRGPMKLAAGESFTTTLRFPGVLPALPGPGAAAPARLGELLEGLKQSPPPQAADTYWGGKNFQQTALLIPVAEQAGKPEIAAQLHKSAESQLQDWFTAPARDGKKDRYFYYNNNWGTLIGHRSSYGSNDQLNDHHFHYGYFIRTAAELARTNPDWARPEQWGGLPALLIRDMASPNRRDPLFPFLRCFDPYAGHSWASGHAKFGDGNNQESCSEAMNAWTGMILWGAATGDAKLRDLGIYLYTTELHAINAYWFDIEDNLFPAKYEQTCAALIWGGKTDHATWFSGEPECIHGIIMLPLQSGSLYLGQSPNYVKRNLASMAAQRGSYNWKEWHDVLWMYEALGDPDQALARFTADPGKIKPHLKPTVYSWIGALQALGQVDASVTANYPHYAVFRKGPQRTYAIYNYEKKPLEVKFSDGFKLSADKPDFTTSTQTLK